MTPLTAQSAPVGDIQHAPQHASAEEFADLIRAVTEDRTYLNLKLKHRREFVARYPDLEEWFAEPLTRRVGRLLGEDPRRGSVTDPISYNARHYLTFLGVTGRVRFDWAWLLAVPALNVWVHAEALNLPLVQTRDELAALGSQVGFQAKTANRAAQWALSRMLLHGGVPSLEEFTVANFQEMLEAIDDFGRRPDRHRFHGNNAQWDSKRRNWGSQVFLLQLLLYHAGHIPEIPKEPHPTRMVWPSMPQVMTDTIERYLAARSLLDRPSTIQNLSAGLRRFSTWMMANRPSAASFAAVTRADCLEFCAWLSTQTHHRTGAPLTPATRRQDIQAVLGFFRDGYAWQWPDMPARPLLMNGDLPKITRAVPRFIPDAELRSWTRSGRSSAPSNAQRCSSPDGAVPAAARSACSTCTASTPTPTEHPGCGCPRARTIPNAPSRSPRRQPTPSGRSKTCAVTRSTGHCPATTTSVPHGVCSCGRDGSCPTPTCSTTPC